jgi:DNA-binding response OmpR family regulator
LDFLNLNTDRVKILAVDDDPDILLAIKSGLDLAGVELEIFTADSGLAALQTAKAERPDIMILDLNMPDINGFDVAEEIRKDPQLENMRIIMLTASDSSKNQWDSIDRQIDDFLGKPFDLRELEARIYTLLMA